MLNIDKVTIKRGESIALDAVSCSLTAGKTLAVVGESGAGKTTLINAILGRIKPSQGRITWSDQPVQICRPALVMQEPRAAFNPAHVLRHAVLEPCIAKQQPVPHKRLKRLCHGLELPEDILARKPNEVSIGQAQRVGILRALMVASPLILFDEPLSALDAVTQKHTAQLIADLQREEGFAALIVTHDIGYAAAYADDIAVLRSGKLEELAPAHQFITAPTSQYSQTLRDAAIALGAIEAMV